jgi:pyridoxamine 5'-phosphate oxidase
VADRPLLEDDLDPDPYMQFQHWFVDAVARGAPQPEAMTVATADADGRPSARMVLLRGTDARGFTFFTNYASRKGRELDGNPWGAVVLHWPETARQVRATGPIVRVSDGESDEYWATRPRGSQVGAWASAQSEVVPDRAALETAVADQDARFAGAPVPRPPGWGGFRLVPDEVEFWQHRDDRLHDRLRYRRVGDGWVVERLQP